MNQNSYTALTAMINAFPQSQAVDIPALLLTFDRALSGVSDRAISEAARRFVSGEVPNRNPTFPPSVAEFAQEARRVPVSRPALPKPETEVRLSPAEKARMRLKMPMYRHAVECGFVDELDRANRAGFSAMVALAAKWGVPVPEELLDMPGDKAEREWQEARRRAWSEIERNPPPFLRGRRKHRQAA